MEHPQAQFDPCIHFWEACFPLGVQPFFAFSSAGVNPPFLVGPGEEVNEVHVGGEEEEENMYELLKSRA